MRRALAAVAVLTLALSGCSSLGRPAAKAPAAGSGSQSPSSGASASADAIGIVIKGDHVEPSGKRVEAKVGQPISLRVRSDRAAELHVHSSPEQELEVRPGVSTLTLTIDKPGVVEVEEHRSDTVLLQLEVR